jgi:hypothetical protein
LVEIHLKNNFGGYSTDLDGVPLCPTEIDGFLQKRIEYFTTLMPLELTEFIMNIIFWKTTCNYGADARGIANISNLSLGIMAPAAEILKKIFGPAVGVQLWWSNWFLVGVHPKKIYCEFSPIEQNLRQNLNCLFSSVFKLNLAWLTEHKI